MFVPYISTCPSVSVCHALDGTHLDWLSTHSKTECSLYGRNQPRYDCDSFPENKDHFPQNLINQSTAGYVLLTVSYVNVG